MIVSVDDDWVIDYRELWRSTLFLTEYEGKQSVAHDEHRRQDELHEWEYTQLVS